VIGADGKIVTKPPPDDAWSPAPQARRAFLQLRTAPPPPPYFCQLSLPRSEADPTAAQNAAGRTDGRRHRGGYGGRERRSSSGRGEAEYAAASPAASPHGRRPNMGGRQQFVRSAIMPRSSRAVLHNPCARRPAPMS
jgi:hypothetical protein